MKGSHCLKHWSKTQQNITLSSAESELVALVKGSCEGIGMCSLMEDLNGRNQGVVDMCTDAAAAIGITQREGVGRTRHIDVGMLWIQQRQNTGVLGIHKVDTTWNPADVLTKPKSVAEFCALAEPMCVSLCGTRSSAKFERNAN